MPCELTICEAKRCWIWKCYSSTHMFTKLPTFTIVLDYKHFDNLENTDRYEVSLRNYLT